MALSEIKFTKLSSTATNEAELKDSESEDNDSHDCNEVAGKAPASFAFFACGRELAGRNNAHQFTAAELEKMNSFGSQNYLAANCASYRHYLATHEAVQKKKYYKWLLMGVTGFVVGVIGYFLKSCIHSITHEKLHFVDAYISNDELHQAFAIFLGIGLLLIILSAGFVVYVCPYAASSGVPAVIAYLNGVYIPQWFTLKVLVIKFVSCVLCVSTQLPVGPEGPMIAMGAVVGSCVSLYHESFNNSKNARDLISAGCASGVSSAFGAPVGGLLFVMEEVSSFWNTRLGWMIFFASMTSVFMTSLLASALMGFEYHGFFGWFDPHVTSIFSTKLPHLTHILLFIWSVMIGCLGGVLGACFTFLNLKANRFRLKFNDITHDQTTLKQKTGVWCILEVVVAVVLWSLICIYLPSAVDCRYIEREVYDNNALLNLHPYNCANLRDENEWLVYNPTASLLLVSPEHAINNLFRRRVSDLFGYSTLFSVLTLYFAFAAYLAGSIISCGFVIPMITIGALYGHIVGKLSQDLFGFDFPDDEDFYWNFIDSGVMALLGSASFFAGVSRLTISLAVIFLEMTDDTLFLLPLMACIMFAKWCGDAITHSLYHAMIELKCLPFLDTNLVLSKKVNLELFPVRYLMTPAANVVILSTVMKVGELINAINDGKHGQYPVVNASGQFVGNILVQHIRYIFAVNAGNVKNVFFKAQCEARQRELESDEKGAFDSDWIPQVDFRDMNMLRDKHGIQDNTMQDIVLNEDDKKYREWFISLKEYVNTSAFVVHDTVSILRAYILFRTMGLRHLTVIDHQNKVIGIATRHDLIGHHIERCLDQYATL